MKLWTNCKSAQTSYQNGKANIREPINCQDFGYKLDISSKELLLDMGLQKSLKNNI